MPTSDVLRDLMDKIDGGVWRDGERLPPERTLAAEYGIARNTLRRALAELEVSGRLIRHVGRGTFVATAHHATSGNRALRDASPEDIMEALLLIEPEAVALATTRATAVELKEIERVYRESVAAKGIAQFELWDAQLHLALVRAARNPVLLAWYRAIDAARNQPGWHWLKQRASTPDHRTLCDRQHGGLLVALLERDADRARRLAHEHLLSMRTALFSLPR